MVKNYAKSRVWMIGDLSKWLFGREKAGINSIFRKNYQVKCASPLVSITERLLLKLVSLANCSYSVSILYPQAGV